MTSTLIGWGLAIFAFLSISMADAQEQVMRGPYEPDHLIPHNLSPGTDSHVRYMNVLRPQLKLNATFFARMVRQPSFEAESCLRLHGNDADISKSSKLFLTYYEADKNIWYSMPENSDDKKQREVTVSVSSAPVSRALANRLRAIWDQMLSGAKPPKKTGYHLRRLLI